MPANFDSYIAGLKPVESVYRKDSKSGNPVENTYDDDAVRRLAVQVVQANFPDIMQAKSNRIKFVAGEPEDFYSKGEYRPWTGEAKVSGRATSRISPQVRTTTDLKTGAKTSEVNITTNEVLDNVFTLLHESQHALGLAGLGVPKEANRTAMLAKAGINESALAVLNKLATDKVFNGALPSMKPGSTPDIEEFLASAIPLQAMAERKMLPESGNLRAMHDTVQSIVQQIPGIQQFIDSQKRPDTPTLKASEPTIVETIKSALFGEKK